MKRRFRSPLLISVVAHAVVGFGLIQLFAMPNPLRSWLERQRVEFQAERIGFLSLPAKSEVSTAGRRGGDDRVESKTPPVATQPTVFSPAAPVGGEPSRVAKQIPAEPGGSGPLVGGGGPLRGIQPSFHDPRLWTIPDEIVTAPRTSAERIDSVFAERVAQYRDSMSNVGPRAASRDWTIGGKDSKWGVDSTGIKIAGVTIPVGPFRPPVGRMEATRRSLAMRMEIEQQSVRRMNEDEFRRAAQRIRERKDREREQSRQQERQKEIAAPAGSSDR